MAGTFARILCARASFELREEDVQAYRRRISSMQQVAQVSAACRAREEDDYRAWQVGHCPPGCCTHEHGMCCRGLATHLCVPADPDPIMQPMPACRHTTQRCWIALRRLRRAPAASG